MSAPVVLAGASGDLGTRIAQCLIAGGAQVTALTRGDTSPDSRQRLEQLGVIVRTVDFSDVGSVSAACRGADCVVSAVSGLRPVIVDMQSRLIDAAVDADVPRFISSDYSADFTRTAPGHNRNFDLRSEFMGRADRAPIRVTSIMVGAFMDMLGAEMPIIRPGLARVLCFGDPAQPLDFTTRADTAVYTAAAALDPSPPRVLRVAGDTVSARDIATAMTDITGRRFRALRVGSVPTLGAMAAVTRRLAPAPDDVFPAWQGMQYMRDQFSGDATLREVDNDRYPGIAWTTVRDHLAGQDWSRSRRGAA